MARTYCHIGEYEKEILELKEQGYTKKEIGQQLGFTEKQIHNFIDYFALRKASIRQRESIGTKRGKQ